MRLPRKLPALALWSRILAGGAPMTRLRGRRPIEETRRGSERGVWPALWNTFAAVAFGAVIMALLLLFWGSERWLGNLLF